MIVLKRIKIPFTWLATSTTALTFSFLANTDWLPPETAERLLTAIALKANRMRWRSLQYKEISFLVDVNPLKFKKDICTSRLCVTGCDIPTPPKRKKKKKNIWYENVRMQPDWGFTRLVNHGLINVQYQISNSEGRRFHMVKYN